MFWVLHFMALMFFPPLLFVTIIAHLFYNAKK